MYSPKNRKKPIFLFEFFSIFFLPFLFPTIVTKKELDSHPSLETYLCVISECLLENVHVDLLLLRYLKQFISKEKDKEDKEYKECIPKITLEWKQALECFSFLDLSWKFMKKHPTIKEKRILQ